MPFDHSEIKSVLPIDSAAAPVGRGPKQPARTRARDRRPDFYSAIANPTVKYLFRKSHRAALRRVDELCPGIGRFEFEPIPLEDDFPLAGARAATAAVMGAQRQAAPGTGAGGRAKPAPCHQRDNFHHQRDNFQIGGAADGKLASELLIESQGMMWSRGGRLDLWPTARAARTVARQAITKRNWLRGVRDRFLSGEEELDLEEGIDQAEVISALHDLEQLTKAEVADLIENLGLEYDEEPGPFDDVCARASCEMCGVYLIPGRNHVSVYASKAQGKAQKNRKVKASFSGMSRCGSSWLCPWCDAILSAQKREAAAVNAERLMTHGWRSILALGTVSHGRDDMGWQTAKNLRLVYAKAIKEYRRQLEDRGIGLEYMCFGEITWGIAAGYHPHFHLAIFVKGEDQGANNIEGLDAGLGDLDFEIAKQLWTSTWLRSAELLGFKTVAEANGAQEARDVEAVVEYISKGDVLERGEFTADDLAAELTGGAYKTSSKSVNPFSLLEIIHATKDYSGRAMDLWVDYTETAEALGRRATSSKGICLSAVPPEEAESSAALTIQDQLWSALATRTPEIFSRILDAIEGADGRADRAIALITEAAASFGIRVEVGRERVELHQLEEIERWVDGLPAFTPDRPRIGPLISVHTDDMHLID